MSDFLDRIGKLSPKRLALLALEQHEQLEAMSRRGREPIAVIGLGCRFPGGADDPAAFWELLREGRDGIIEVPAERWDIDAFYDPDPDAPARMSARNGGFLSRIGGFDAAFFGISPREALTMDPQQRLLLEVSWEALEHAGLAVDSLAGSPTGVFVGICNSDHFSRLVERGADTIDAYLASGNAHSVAAGRISYCLGLQGPAISVDTACSSSLVALHLACRSLRAGESKVALAAGVNVMCSPETTIALSKAHMLAPDGRCKTFDASADGFSRGEGCGVLILKRLEDALADGNRVLAVIRGTAVNQDGRSGGLTVPNGRAQEAVIRAALADAGVDAGDIDYVEAHGTGTSLGDPIEVRALAGSLGHGRDRSNPLLVGSVKTNIGHLESAAGIAGVMKVVLALQNERIPPHLHFKEPSPHIAWKDYPVSVEPRGRDWQRNARARIAGVSSFGFSGTNAHIIIEEAPVDNAQSAATDASGLFCLPLSARSEEALAALAGELANDLSRNSRSLSDVASTLGDGRSHMAVRAAILASSVAEAVDALRAIAANKPHEAVLRGTAVPGQASEWAFLFTGQGSQYPGMGRVLYERAPAFREIIDRCDALLGADAAGRTLKIVLWDSSEPAPLHETSWTQPALFALEYAITELWRSWGIRPAAVIGHSVGEYAAACAAGVFSLEEGLKLIAERGRLMQALPPGGTMAALFAPHNEVAAAIEPYASRVAIAAVNAADSVVISGEAAAIEALLKTFESRNIRGHRLFVQLAAHSPLMEPALDQMQASAAKVAMSAPSIPVAWNVTGGKSLPAGNIPDATYWRRHLREPVRFADGVASLKAQGFTHFLEVGPHPTLVALAERSLPEGSAHLVSSLRRNKDDWSEILGALAQMYVRGADVQWKAVNAGRSGRVCTLPTYPFERREFWIPRSDGAARFQSLAPLPGDALRLQRLPTAAIVFQTTLTPASPSYLSQHCVHGAALVAGPVFLELAYLGAREALRGASLQVEDFTVREALVLPSAGRVIELQLSEDAGRAPFSVYSHDPANKDAGWTLHASGRLVPLATADAGAASLEAVKRAAGALQSCEPYYAKLAGLGIEMGSIFRTLREASRWNREALARIGLDTDAKTDGLAWAHPALIDGAFQSVGLAVPESSGTNDIFLLTGVERVQIGGFAKQRSCWSHATLRPASENSAELLADVTLYSETGEVIGSLSGVCLRRASREALRRAAATATAEAPAVESTLFYKVDWQDSPVPTLAPPATFKSVVHSAFARASAEYGMQIYDSLLPELDRLCAEHALVAFTRLRFASTPGRTFDAETEAVRLKVLPRHARLFVRLLEMLCEDGWLRRSSNGHAASFEVLRAFPHVEPTKRYAALLERFGNVNGELLTLRRCADELASVLNGSQDPLQLLFPGGSLTEARQLYVESPYARTYNTALAEALRAAIARLPSGARLRVLEIGAGTGGTTTYVLPHLPADRVAYTFTDLSPLFLERAAEQFAAYPFVRRALLDIEKPPAQQGFAPGAYDVVIAANVLHATADLGVVVDHVRELLAPGGELFLLEGVAPERWVDLTFGLTEGWWRFTDHALRPGYPLIAREQWRTLLTEHGFDDVVMEPEGTALARGAAQQALVVARAARRLRKWTLVGDADGLAAELASRLRARGDAVECVAAETGSLSVPAVGDLVYLGALPLADLAPDDLQGAARSESLACSVPIAWLAQLAQNNSAARSWLITRGAQPVQGQTSAGARWQAPLWGVGRVFSLERPTNHAAVLDLPPAASTSACMDLLLDAFDGADSEDQIAWRDGRRYVARLEPQQAPQPSRLKLRADATYLITGGFGGLGVLVARWMVENGARHIALLGRNPDVASEPVRSLEALGAEVIPLAGDVASESDMRDVFARLDERHPPLRGIVHAAASFSVAPIEQLTEAQVRSMLRPKISGTVLLERLAKPRDLDFFVLFSSSTALLGAGGYAHYAAANMFLDATAHAINNTARRVVSINWGTWEAMRLATEESQRSYRESGLAPMAAEDALQALSEVLGTGDPQWMVASIDWSVLKPLHEARRIRPLLANVGGTEVVAERVSKSSAAVDTWLETLAKAPADARLDVLTGLVKAEVAQVLGLGDSNAVAPDMGLFEMGMDSLMSVELRKRLERGAGRKLPATLTFNYPNVSALASFLDQEIAPTQTAAAPAAAPTSEPEQVAEGDLDSLTDEELEARLLARLSQTK